LGQKNYYEILQVHHKAGPKVIKRAFKTLAAEYHPDKHPSSKKKWADENFKLICEAYEVLSDEVSRSDYDLLLRTRGMEASAIDHDIEYEREAFYHLRRGLMHYERAIGSGLLYSLLGKWDSDLEKSRAHLLKVISSLPDATLVEDARFYYFRVLTRLCDYSGEYIESVKDEYELFLSDYPSSDWVPRAKLEMSDFYVAKCMDFKQALAVLQTVVGETVSEELASLCSARIFYLEEGLARRCEYCGRRLLVNKGICYRCRTKGGLKGDGEDIDPDEMVSKTGN
jgi:hypothetical protein